MNTKFIWGAIVVVVLILVGSLYWFFGRTSPTPTPVGTSTGTFPSAGNVTPGNGQGGSITVAEIQQGSITVRNFKDDPTTIADPVNKGYYYIAGGDLKASTNPSYRVFYDEAHQYFGVALYQEPLGQNRLEAEQKLQKALGLSNDDMCRLNYFVGVGKGVNDLYIAKNLGFSFCPGATALP